MKKKEFIAIMLLSICVAVTNFGSVFADNDTGSDIPDDMNASSITSEIVEFVNSMTESAQAITEEDVDLSKAFKIYIETDVFHIESNNLNELLQTLNAGMYIFEVPIYVGSDTYMANVQRSMPIDNEAAALLAELYSPEEIADRNAHAGEWTVSGVAHYPDEHKDYYTETANLVGITDKKPIIVGSLPYFRYATLLYPDDVGNIDKMVLTIPEAVDWELLGIPTPQGNDVVLDYMEVKAIVNSLPPINYGESDTTISGAGDGVAVGKTASGGERSLLQFIFLAIFVILIVGIIALICRKTRKSVE